MHLSISNKSWTQRVYNIYIRLVPVSISGGGGGGGGGGRHLMQLPMQSVPFTTKVVISNPAHGKVYSIQHYVIKFISDLQQVWDFLCVLRFPPPINLTTKI